MGNVESKVETVPNKLARDFLDAIVEESEENLPEGFEEEHSGHMQQSFELLLKQLMLVPTKKKNFPVVVRNRQVYDWEVDCIAELVQNCTFIGSLEFYNCSLTVAAAERLGEMLSENEGLVSLNVANNASFADEGVKHIIDNLADHEELKELNVSGTGCGDESVDSLVELWKRNKTLSKVDLCNNNIGKKSCEALADQIRDHFAIEDVRIDGNSDLEQSDVKRITDLVDRNASVALAIEEVIKHSFLQIQLNKRAKETTRLRSTPGITETESAPVSRQRGGTIDIALLRPKMKKQEALKFDSSESLRFTVGHHETVGRRSEMQDTMLVRGCFRGNDFDLFAVFDGHGGQQSSIFAAEHFPGILSSHLDAGVPPSEALTLAFLELNGMMKDHVNYGTTALVALIIDKLLYVANVGDSRAVLCRGEEAIRLSVDHKADVPEEKARVEALGGFVKNGRIQGVLQVSRAFGDAAVQPYVSAEPYVSVTELSDDDSHLVLACDGLYDIFSDEVTARIARASSNAQIGAERLVNQAYISGSTDNISCILIALDWKQPTRGRWAQARKGTPLPAASVVGRQRRGAPAPLNDLSASCPVPSALQ